ncbi:MAG TPA: hypothetical protein VIB79_21120 [Candidatus Binatia bacterium]|jgi:hypothetical protein
MAQALAYGLVTYLASSAVLLMTILSGAQKRENRWLRRFFRFLILVMTVSAAVVICSVLYKINLS